MGDANPMLASKTMPKLSHWLTIWLTTVVSTGCSVADPIRGKDHDAIATHGLLTYRLGRVKRDSSAEGPRPVLFTPVIEAGVAALSGDFRANEGFGEYSALVSHVAFRPEIAWRNLALCPLVGFAYGDVEVELGTQRVGQGQFGPTLGLEFSYGLTPWLATYARLQAAYGSEWSVERKEFGLEVRPAEAVGMRIAYFDQDTKLDSAPFFANQAADIDARGVVLGLALRF